MSEQYEVATLSVTLDSRLTSMSDARFVIDALDGISTSTLWGALSHVQYDDNRIYKLRKIVLAG